MKQRTIFVAAILAAATFGAQARACSLNSTQNEQDNRTQSSASQPAQPSSAAPAQASSTPRDTAQPVGRQASNQTTGQRGQAPN